MPLRSVFTFGDLVLTLGDARPPARGERLSALSAMALLRNAVSSGRANRVLALAEALGAQPSHRLGSDEYPQRLRIALSRIERAIDLGTVVPFGIAPLSLAATGAAKKQAPAPAPAPAPVPAPKDEPNVVTPKVEAEILVALLDRDLAKHQAQGEAPLRPDPTRVTLGVDQSWPAGHPFKTGGKLKASPANVEAFLDEGCTIKAPGSMAAGVPLSSFELSKGATLHLRGTKAGLFDLVLELDPTGDGMVQAKPAPPLKMGVVKLELELQAHDVPAVAKIKVDPDTDPVETYHTNLEDTALPDQKAITEAARVAGKRLLHVQKDGSFGRARLVVKKLEAGEWPPGTDDYEVVLADASESGAVEACADEWDGAAPAPVKLKVSALKAAEKVVWVQGKAATKPGKLARLDLGVGAAGKASKGKGDVARFTVVEIKEVALEYQAQAGKPAAWDAAEGRFHVNLAADDAAHGGRKITVGAQLGEALADVVIHFMLAPDANNLKAANWGVGLPATWKWKDVPADLKHLDRKDRKDLLHLWAKTDAKGHASKELVLSRFGGDRFHLGCYLAQDPHLAKYVRGHAELEKRKPVLAASPVTVWRKFWYEVVKVEGLNAPALTGAEGEYTLVKASMTAAPDLNVTRATVDAMSPKAIYPRYMVKVNGGNGDALVVSDRNKTQFFTGVAASAERPIKVPILICDAQWDAGGPSAPAPDFRLPAARFPVDVRVNGPVIDPPLQGGALLVGGTWEAAEVSGAGPPRNVRSGSLRPGDVAVNPSRDALRKVQLKLPADLRGVGPETQVAISGFVVNVAKGPYLGESFDQKILAVYKPEEALDFQNTIAHELGHAFQQVAKGPPAGIPAHPHQYDHQGSHCRFGGKKCMMYQSGPEPDCLNRFCDVCHPYVLLQDMSSVT